LKRANKKQARTKRFIRRMKSHAKWKHGRSNAEKIRRKEAVTNLKTQ